METNTMPDIGLDIDTSEFEQAVDMLVRRISFADYHVITENAQKFIRHLDKNVFGFRTGNLKSSLIPPWQALRMEGRPSTNITTGEKTIRWNEGGKIRVNKFISSCQVEDERTKPDKPYFKFACFAAEWRPRRGNRPESISKILKSGLLSISDMKNIAGLLAGGASYEQVYTLIVNLLSTTGPGITLMMGEGSFRPYQFVAKGNRKTITPKFDFGKWHQKEMDKARGK